MPQFLVRYASPQGQLQERLVDALDAHAATAQLGVLPSAVLSVAAIEAGVGSSGARPGPSSKAFPLRLFSQQLGVLLKAGIPLLEALQTLKEKEESPAVAQALAAVVAELQQGQPLSAALRTQPDCFDALFIAVVESSERTGQLQRALQEQADYLAWVQELRSKLVAASIYPATLIVAGTAVLLFLLLFVVPRFAGLLEGVGGDMPWASRMLIEAGRLGGDHPWILIGAGVALLAAPVLAWRQGGLRGWVSERLWALPLLGPKLQLLALAQLYRTLSMLLGAGVPVVAALGTARGVIAARLRPPLDGAAQAVREGERLSAALERAALTTPVSLRMLRVGERSGELGSMLGQAAAFYDEELSRLTELVTRLVNPVLMLIMGVVIGAVVVLMYLPIFQLVEQVQ